MNDMKNIISCEFNNDNGCEEVAYKDGNFLKLNVKKWKRRFGQQSSN